MNARGGGERRLTRTGDSGVETWAPGRKIGFSRSGIDGARPASGGYIVNADGTGLRSVPRTSDFRRPSTGGWSPSGKLLLYVVGVPHGILTWRPSDGSVRRLTRSSADGDPAWDRRGREIAFTRNGLPRTRGIWIVDRNGTGAHRIAVAPNPYGFWGPNLYYAPSWAPR